MNNIRFKFGEPEHGWIGVIVGDSNHEVVLEISDVPCNSLYKLTDVLLELKAGSKFQEVEFSLEPDFALWKFINLGHLLEIHVYPNSSCEEPFVFSGCKDKVLHNRPSMTSARPRIQCRMH
ncbi:hypothetical protein CS022_24560 [Veronia nyctiphanis]|uniref:Uncharacterized protein n=1 Tax=Veronia nyctiphanis TaxID=1278244 RepID=A0A4Q0Y9D9_9GAMM|nr:hypothetical protein CS022_24560 [Veronia nyctiphanis]